MPIEIKELIIRAVIDPEAEGERPSGDIDEATRASLVRACVAETLRLLRKSRER